MRRSNHTSLPYNSFSFVVCFACCYTWNVCHAYVADKNQEFTFQVSPQNTIWPLPRKQVTPEDSHILSIDPSSFRFVPWPSEIASECDIIREAIDRYGWVVTSDKRSIKDQAFPELTKINITVRNYQRPDFCGYPKLGDNETYFLNITADPPEASLSSPTVWGMLRGLETFSQLVYRDSDTDSYLINTTSVEDWPKFSHRGVLLDTARHFITVKVLKKNLDAMAYNKMNVFHWHIVDDQSFPFESKVYPNLTLLGAFSSKHVYLQEEIEEVIQYARLRGIRVVPEFDSPGHTRAIGKAFPNLLMNCDYNLVPVLLPSLQMHVPSSGLNPTNEGTYHFMKEILAEFKTVFQDAYIHLGMDETNIKCWLSNFKIQRYMAENKYSAKDLEEYYARRVMNITQAMGYKYLIWADPLENGVEVAPDTVVQLWKADWISRAKHLALMNHQMVLSSCWYMDLISYGETWTKYYKCNPLIFSRNASERQLMLGGEACLWGEYIDNTNLLQTLWPSASAVAERLWNGDENLYPDDQVRKRFDQQRCRMLRRGIPASPVYSGFCEEDYLDLEVPSKVILQLPFETRPNILFVWLFVVISVLCSFYWVTLSRPLLRSMCCKSCPLGSRKKNHVELKSSRT